MTNPTRPSREFARRLQMTNWRNCERFEPRSHFKSGLSLIVWVNVVLNRTVVDSDWHFHNLCGSHLQCKSELFHVSRWLLIWLVNYVAMLLVVCQLSLDVIQLTLTLKITTAQVVETSVTVNNNPIQDYIQADVQIQPTFEVKKVARSGCKDAHAHKNNELMTKLNGISHLLFHFSVLQWKGLTRQTTPKISPQALI